jgi:CRP-like cAMP-binding protein
MLSSNRCVRLPVETSRRVTLEDVVGRIPHIVIKLHRRRIFREPGTAGGELLLIRSGLLAKYMTNSSGKRQFVALRYAGEWILPTNGGAAYGIEAMQPSEIVAARADEFHGAVSAEPDLQQSVWAMMQRQEAISYQWLMNCARADAVARVAHLLCETVVRSHIDPDEQPLVNPFTQQQIADLTGQTPVNVNRILAQFERDGVIGRSGPRIHIRDWVELRRIGSFQSSYLGQH